MERDMGLVREILMEVEKIPFGKYSANFHIDGHSKEEVSYHICIMQEAGLVVAFDEVYDNEINFIPTRLTWAGHEFLEKIRPPGAWESILQGARMVGGFSIDLAVMLGTEWIKKAVGL